MLEVLGITDCLTKCYGSTNSFNVVKAVFDGLTKLRQREDIEKARGMELGKSHRGFKAPLTSLSFHRSHDLLAVSTGDDEIHVLSLATGEPARPGAGSQVMRPRQGNAGCEAAPVQGSGELLSAGTSIITKG